MTTTTSVTMSVARYAALTARAKAEGITRPEVLRRALDDYTASPSMFAQGAASRDAEVKGLTDSLQLTGVQYRAAQGTIADLRAQVAELEAEITPPPVTLYENAATTRVTLPANKHGGAAGINKPYPLAKVVDEATTSYEVMFDPDFTWHLGGKLPGPVGVVAGASPTWPTGGKPDPDNLGWSGRLMWLAGGTYTGIDGTKRHPLAPAEVLPYVYHPGQRDNYGDYAWTGFVPTPGEWFIITQRNVMNTPGKADGTLQLWINGRLLVDRHDFTYRVRGDLHITHFLYVCFPGGDTTAYEAPVDRHVSFRNVLVTTPG